MRHLLLPVKRPFNGRAYLILVGLLVPAIFAILPFALTLSAATSSGSTVLPFPVVLLDRGINLLLVAALGAAGLLLASRIGLGLPFIEGWMNREPVWNRLPGVVGVSIMAGILSAGLLMGLSIAIAPLMKHTTEILAERYSATEIVPPAWQGFLAAISAGITEETLFRLFGLTLLAWLGSLLFRSPTGRPAPGLLWTANILFAILFGLAHLPLVIQIGMPLDAVIVIRTILLNGVAGVVFGWLYWSFGLESAILAHFSIDVVMHSFIPLMTQQEEITKTIIAGVAVALVLILIVIWSIRAILRDRKLFPPATVPDAVEMEVGLSHPTV